MLIPLRANISLNNIFNIINTMAGIFQYINRVYKFFSFSEIQSKHVNLIILYNIYRERSFYKITMELKTT